MPMNRFCKRLLEFACITFALVQIAAAQFPFEKHTKGKFENNIYTSPEKDFQIQAPTLTFGRWVEDHLSKEDGSTIVVFGDVLGSSYSVLSYPAFLDITLDEALLSSAIVYEKQPIQTVRGREWRVLSKVPHGASVGEITADNKEIRHDLISAGAIFAINGRTYSVTAGASLTANTKFEDQTKAVRDNLEVFLAGFRANNVPPNNKSPNVSIEKKIEGTFSNNIYTSVLKDYRVAAPKPFRIGSSVRDENSPIGSEVIFADDYGGFYRIVSFNKTSDITMEQSLRALKKPIEQQEIQTARGKEFRILNVELAGAEVSVKTADAEQNPKTGLPDLVTANAVFIANGRVYHVIAGAINFDTSSTQAAGEIARRRLEKFLAGFEPM
jgi:hypothetical protein